MKCTKCGLNHIRAVGLCSTCYSSKWREENRERSRKYLHNYYLEHREEAIEFAKQWNKENPERAKKAHQLWEKNSNYYNNRYQVDLDFRLKCLLRTRLLQGIKTDQKSGSAVQDLGCSIQEFKDYLEAKFSPGMSWDNIGEWHLDHVIPLSSFDLTNREQFLKACHYTNIQPLWKEDNLKKSDNLSWGDVIS